MRLKPTREQYEKVLQLRKADLSIRVIAEKTGIAKSAIHRWLTIFAGEKPADMKTDKPKRVTSQKLIDADNGKSAGAVEAPGKSAEENAQEKIARLEKELKEMRLKADLYKEVIDLSEKRYGINLLKKSWRQAINNLHAQSPKKYPIETLCRLVGISKQAYHKQKGESATRKADLEAFAIEYIHSVRAIDPGLGGLKLWFMYKREFPDRETIGRDWFEEIIHRNGLKVRNKMRKPRTTDSTHGLPVYPNLAYDFIPTAINQLWVSDITFIPIWLTDSEYAFCYLSLIMDAFSHEIIGWAVGPTLETLYPANALKMAFKRLEGLDKEIIAQLIHHSDRGVQYASKEYLDLLREFEIKVSMTENGDPKENAIAERINNTVKNELLKGLRFSSIKEVRDALDVAIRFYNILRPHMSIDMMTPEDAAKCNGEIRKWWKSYREEAIKKDRA